ncbi:DUF4386 domain-containing protein [Prolixibacter denitrificans]|jgi:hypothetical protein|uniref:DUF4386 domain-containing protein n=1 Tax=Prolixibacter denitrificans TaxID=1541063 RepID=A0A2P8CL72_9BACT|nr:DUF4386 domain-containing protein [Prolixibacter denitrificans]PSK85719.1 uncharacterized protein DUF4386 [Prolixibacter denitrificans]GET20338.1 DUF4386 domain-containing protein [Prolixibacter denitrificans]
MVSKRNSAQIAGIAILIMAAVAAFTYGYIHNSLVVPNHSETTIGNLKASTWLFRTEIVGWHFILLCDVVVAWALYKFFKDENQLLSQVTAILRLIYAAFLGGAVFKLISILRIINGEAGIAPELAGQQMLSFLKSFESTWSFGLIIFGFHLLLLGFLALQSKAIHSSWGVLLILAALSYITIHSSKIGFPQFDSQIKTAETILSLPMALGEVGFAVWLIIRGGKPKMKINEAFQNS